MLASVRDAQGAVTLHRTYLRDGPKARCAGCKEGAEQWFLLVSPCGWPKRPKTSPRSAKYRDRHRGVPGEGGPVVRTQRRQPRKIWIPQTVSAWASTATTMPTAASSGKPAPTRPPAGLRGKFCHRGRREVRPHLPRRIGSDWADVWRQRDRKPCICGPRDPCGMSVAHPFQPGIRLPRVCALKVSPVLLPDQAVSRAAKAAWEFAQPDCAIAGRLTGPSSISPQDASPPGLTIPASSAPRFVSGADVPCWNLAQSLSASLTPRRIW